MVGQVVKVQIVGGNWIHGDSEDGRGRKKLGQLCVVERVKWNFYQLRCAGGTRVFIWGSRVGRVSGGTAARSQVAGSINQCRDSSLPCRSWLKSHRRG